jgi:hypothetical protein
MSLAIASAPAPARPQLPQLPALVAVLLNIVAEMAMGI